MEEKNKNEIETSIKTEENEEVREAKKDNKKFSFILTFALSLLASVVMWIVAVDYEVADYEKTFFNIEIEVKGKSELFSATQLQVVYDDAFTVDVTVSGKRSRLSSLSASSFSAYIDVSSIKKEGKSDSLKVEIEPINGVEIISQSITALSVNAERKTQVEIEIIPHLGTAQFENGVDYQLVCDVQTVKIIGSESVLNNITGAFAYVNPEPKNVTSSFSSRCEIVLQSEVEINMDSLSISPSHCNVEVVLTKEKTVPLVPVLDGAEGVEYNTSFRTDFQKVLIKGEPAAIDAIESIGYEISYEKVKSLIGTGKEKYEMECSVLYPENVYSADNVQFVNVTVLENVSEIVIPGENIVFENCPPNYVAKAEDVTLMLTGLYEEVKKIKVSNIKITVDLSQNEFLSGNYSGIVEIDRSFGVVYEAEQMVEVTISKAF